MQFIIYKNTITEDAINLSLYSFTQGTRHLGRAHIVFTLFRSISLETAALGSVCHSGIHIVLVYLTQNGG